MPAKYSEQGEEELKRLIKQGLIKMSNPPYTCLSFFYEKYNDLRLVINYREINKYIEADPRISP